MLEMTERPEPAPVKPLEWWEMPGATATTEEVQAALRRNLEELEERRDKAPSGWKRAL